jgi:quercetin dioxygenase-like cupin family protein
MALTHFASCSIISLQPLGAGLASAVTSTILKAPQLELIRIVLMAGKEMRVHKVFGEITVQCIEGRMELRTPQTTLLLRPGDLVHLQGNTLHALKALEDASALLTIRLNMPLAL